MSTAQIAMLGHWVLPWILLVAFVALTLVITSLRCRLQCANQKLTRALDELRGKWA